MENNSKEKSFDQAEKLRDLVEKANKETLEENELKEKKILNTEDDTIADVITVTSGKGGVGKSSFSVNLAIKISKLGKKVLIIDADFGLANIEIMFGMSPKYTLADLLFKDKNIEDIIIKGPEDISFISGGSGISELNNLTKDQLKKFMDQASLLFKNYDTVIIDTAAGINDNILDFIFSSKEVILLVTKEPTSITDGYALLKNVNLKDGAKDVSINVITNRVKNEKEGQLLFNKLYLVIKKYLDLDIKYLGAIPYDDNISNAIIKQTPFVISYPNTIATKSLDNIVQKLYNSKTENKKKDIKTILKFFLGLKR